LVAALIAAVIATVALRVPAVAETTEGAPGTPGADFAATLTELDGAEAGPFPIRFRARTVHVYVLPAVRPATTTNPWEKPTLPDFELPPSLEVHVAL